MDFLSFLDKVDENLKAAQLCFDNGLYNAYANRSYYAMFQIGVTILAAKGFPSAQEIIGHKWVQSMVARELIKRRKIFPNKFRSYLPDAQAVRERADYKLQSVTKKVASRQLSKAQEFIDVIKKELMENDRP